MGQPFIGEIRMFAGNFAPAGWMFCDGQLLPIAENDALFTLIGTTYGGDGQETFALPNLQSRVPMHQGNGFILAETGGAEEITLTTQQIPIHNHAMVVSTSIGNDPNPAGGVLAESSTATMYVAANPTTPMAVESISPIGGSQPHENLQPYLGINFIISLFGIYPQTP